MSSIKIYPPNQLPSEGVTDVQFAIWKEELEVYLEIEDKFQKFLPGGRYATWTAAETNEERITRPKSPDLEEHLPKIRRELRQFITLVAKYVHMDYYNPIVRHSTSLQWVYKKIREDYDIQQQGIHFLNILDIVYDPTAQTTPIGFYNSYRSHIMGNMAKKGDVILWKQETMAADEKLSPTQEDLILLNVLTLIHPKLPAYVKENYGHKIGTDKRLMDFKTEILTKAKQYITEIESPQLSAACTEEPSCNYIRTSYQQNRSFQPRSFTNNNRSPNTFFHRPPRFNSQQPPNPRFNQASQGNRFSTPRFQQPLPPFCRVCQIAGLPRHVFTSHYLGQPTCPSLSNKDKQMLVSRTAAQLNAVQLDEDTGEDIAADYGYEETEPEDQQEQVEIPSFTVHHNTQNSHNFRNEPACNFIQPIPTQTLSLQDENKNNIHLDLDSGATVSYAKLSTVLSHGFVIKPNSQLSNLADGKTKMPSAGEIDITLYRNNWQVRFQAIVTKELHCDFVAGNNFIKENSIIQDFENKTITVKKKYTIPETNKQLILPTQPNNLILQNNHIQVLLPGQELQQAVPHPENTVISVEPWFQNKSLSWPQPQLCKVKNGLISIPNLTSSPIDLKRDVPRIQIRTTAELSNSQLISGTSTSQPLPPKYLTPADNIHLIEINTTDIAPQVIDRIMKINKKFSKVFDEDLSEGYNMKFGKHICRLNWANSNRPQANKVHAINYDHKTKCLMQQVCDEFTAAGVLGIPQSHDIQIQQVSPAFLVRKQRAKNKPKDQLTSKDVRLVVNFGKLNEHLKNIPSPITKPKTIFSQLGKWNYLITMDLFQGFYQNHMSLLDAEWLGISTPFGGLRFLRRSGQGLIGQSEEMDELLSKIIGPEIQMGIAARIADDLYIGGETPEKTAENYMKVLEKLEQANIKISASKTKIFLQSVDVLGWKWQQGGFLAPSPHRKNALKNSKIENIKTVKDMRSWMGLYKTLLPASKNLTLLLDPFDKLVADRDSKEPFAWDRELQQHFIKATDAVDDLQTLYLPHPNDQLMIVVDAAKTNPGIGHAVYAIKDNKKLPVAFHSVKLQKPYSNWLPCELEALAFATAITAEYDIIKESKQPVIISPDSKSVADAVKLIKKGHFSTNPRIQTMITNVNRAPIIVQMASGKSNLNACGDFQSRNASSCSAEHCAICSFVKDKANSPLDAAALNSVNLLPNLSAW